MQAELDEYLQEGASALETFSQKQKRDLRKYPDKQEIENRAHRIAKECAKIFKVRPVPNNAAGLLLAICERENIEFPKSKNGIEGAALRLVNPKWWKRQLTTFEMRAFENREVLAGKIHRKYQLYCSDFAVQEWRHMKRQNAEFLQQVFCFSDEGYINSLQEIAQKSVANPEVRRAEMMCRMRGFEDYAREHNHKCVFVTLTCPSKYHPKSKKYGGYSPKQAQEYLCDTWARIRSKFARKGIKPYGFRVAEPHHDGCPHWHMVLFVPDYQRFTLNAIIAEHALRVDGTESGATTHRAQFELIPMTKSATGYLAKYISKNIDGKTSEGNSFTATDDINGQVVEVGDSISAAERVLAWSSIWGIRQFQQIGGERIGSWRELRRVKTAIVTSADLEACRAWADSGEFGKFLKSVDELKENQPGGMVTVKLETQNEYGEPVQKVIGIADSLEEIITRDDTWTIMTSREIEQAYDFALTPEEKDFFGNLLNEIQILQAGAADKIAPWTCGNNCTGGEIGL